MTGRTRNLLELNVAVLLWGGTALFAKWVALPAFQIAGLRSWVAAGVLALLLAWQRERLWPKSGRDLMLLLVVGGSLAAHWVTYFHAMQVSTIAVGILALHTYPVMTAVMEPLVFRERFRALDLVIAAVVLLGVLVLVPEFSLTSATTQGVLWGILSAVFFTIRNLLSRQLIRRYSGTQIMWSQSLACALVLLPVVLRSGQPVTAGAGAKLLLLGLVFTALPQTLFTNSLAHLKTRTVSVIATLLPVYGTISAALLLHEIPSARTLVGGAIILVAVFWETFSVVRHPEPTE